MKIASGVTDQFIYFVAVDLTDLKTRETGLTGFTVRRSRNGGASVAFTTPTINETDSANMPGVYELLLDEDMTIDAGDETQEYCLHITQASMTPVTRTFELYRPKITAGNTLGVASDGDVSGNLDGTVATVTTLTGHTVQTGDSFTRLGVPAGASIADDLVEIEGQTDDIGVAGAGLTDLGGMSTGMQAEIEKEADDALVAQNLDHLVGTATGIPTIVPGTYIDQMQDDGTATYDRTTDSLQAVRDRGDAAWTTGAGGTPPQLLQSTTIATLASQTSFTLTAGSADNNAYNLATVVITDSATSTQKAIGLVSDYIGASKTVILSVDPGIFTMAVGDKVEIIANSPNIDVLVSSRTQPEVATNIATLASQVSFTLDSGSPDDDAYNGWTCIITDVTNASQKAVGLISDYTGSTKTVTLEVDPGIFTMAVGDFIQIETQRVGAETITAGGVDKIADALLDRVAGIETGFTPRQALRLILAALVGKLSGAATTNILIRDVNDTKDRINATVDASGNRTAVTKDTT